MTNHTEVHQSLLKIYPFSDEQLNLFTSNLVYQTVEKHTFLLQPKQVCDGLTFVIQGSFRLYTDTEKTELTINFFTENTWVADLESLLMQQPSQNYIVACEHTEVAIMPLKHIHTLMDTYPVFRMLNALLANLIIPANHIATINTQKPDERYKKLLMNHPDWVNRFPQMQIASYLGMTPETLSRVRARMV